MTSFSVDHRGFAEVNALMSSAVGQMGTILDDLNRVLKNMGQATQGKAVPLWAEQQTHWNKQYLMMHGRLTSGSNAAGNVANVFDEGDRRGQQIMAG